MLYCICWQWTVQKKCDCDTPPIKYIHSPTRHLQAKGFLLYRQRLSHEWFLSTKVRVLSVIKYYLMYLLVYLLSICPFGLPYCRYLLCKVSLNSDQSALNSNIFFTQALILLHTNKWMKIGIKDNIVSSIVVSTTQLLHCRRVYNAELEMYV